MEEFLKQNYFLITHSVEFLAAMAGILLYNKYRKTAAKFLPFFLVFALIVDLMGNYPNLLENSNKFHLIKDTLFEKNYWLSNIFWFIGLVSFLHFTNYAIVKKRQFRLVLKYSYAIYLVLFFIYGVYNFDLLFTTLNSFVATLSLWMVLVSTSVFLVETLESDKILFFHKSIYFYINTSILIWSLIVVPLAFYDKYFTDLDSDFILLRAYIFLFLNIVFYLTLTLALIFCKPQNK